MAPDITGIYSDLYDRAATDAAGSAVRALVGSIFLWKDPMNFNGKTLPYLGFRHNTPDGQARQMSNINVSWWAYVGPADDIRDLTTLASAVYALYREPFAIAGGRVEVLLPRAPFPDTALKLQGIQIPFYFRTLG